MARHRKSPPQVWAEYLAARAADAVIGLAPTDSAIRMAAAIGRSWCAADRWASSAKGPLRPLAAAWLLLGRDRRARALDAIARAFPDQPPDRLDRIARACFEHLLMLGTELCHAPRLLRHDLWADRITLDPTAPAIRRLLDGRPVIMVTGHWGNWEVMGHFLASVGFSVSAVARAIDNPLLNRWFLGLRQQRGLRIIDRTDAASPMIDQLRAGGVLGLVADQNAGARGLFVPFFGRLASTHKSIALLAIAHQTPVVVGGAERVGPGSRFRVRTTDYITPDDWTDQPDPVYYLTARYCRALERLVLLRPEQYLWMHRRWRTRPKHEREAKPLPASLRRKLEALPWMTEPELNRLTHPDTAAAPTA